jgi:hypothetical protein
MARFPPETSVLRTVKMTRTAYAQLLGQKFHPPKIFGRWQEREGTNEWRHRDVGMKIVGPFNSSAEALQPTTVTGMWVRDALSGKQKQDRRYCNIRPRPVFGMSAVHSACLLTLNAHPGCSEGCPAPEPRLHEVYRLTSYGGLLQRRAGRVADLE